jgi:hypothetical protein
MDLVSWLVTTFRSITIISEGLCCEERVNSFGDCLVIRHPE